MTHRELLWAALAATYLSALVVIIVAAGHHPHHQESSWVGE